MTSKCHWRASLKRGTRPSEETAEDSKIAPPKKAAFNRKYPESYLNDRFTATGDSPSPSPLCIICGEQLSNKAMKPSKLLHRMDIKHPALKDKPSESFKRKPCEHEGQKQLPKATASANAPAPRASFSVAHRSAQAEKPFPVGVHPACC